LPDLLVCPKCRRELRHLGVDYGKPGNIVVCRTCGAVNSEPHVHFICMDCSAVTPAEDSVPMDWYHYDLTANGLSTLREGRLPQFGFNPKLERVPRTYSAREFGLLAMQETRTARQFRRPLSVLRVSFPNIDAVRRDLGLAATDAAIRHVVDGNGSAKRLRWDRRRNIHRHRISGAGRHGYRSRRRPYSEDHSRKDRRTP
jgi:uncharacterized protein YbaR (Trm112 family)